MAVRSISLSNLRRVNGFFPRRPPLPRSALVMADGPCGHSSKRRQLCGKWLRRRAGGRAGEYALHSQRIGSATHLSGGGVTPEVLERQGRWASDECKTCVHSHGNDGSWAADDMAQEGTSGGIHPGQGTDWRRVNSP